MRGMKGVQLQRIRTDQHAAFSLIEVMTVIVILGILSAIAIPRFARSANYHRSQAAAQRLMADLKLARQHARVTSASLRVNFSLSGDSYTLGGLSHPDHPDQPYVVTLSDSPYEADIVSADCGGSTTLIYDGYGNASSSAKIVIQAGSFMTSVKVEAQTGRVTIE